MLPKTEELPTAGRIDRARASSDGCEVTLVLTGDEASGEFVL